MPRSHNFDPNYENFKMARKQQALTKKQKQATKRKNKTHKPPNVTGDVNKTPRRIGVANPAAKAALSSKAAAVCSITDPFCSVAMGARIPDGQARTFTATGRGQFALSTAASGGVACAALVPLAPYGYATSSITAFPYTVPAWTTYATLGAGTLFNTYADRVRVVSAGFILRATQSANNAQGQFLIQTHQTLVGDGASSVIANDFNALDNQTVTNYPGMEYSYIFKPVNKVLARQFNSLNGGTAASDNSGWPGAVINYSGGNAVATQIASVEYYINVEFTLKTESALAPLLPALQTSHPSVLKAADDAMAKIPAGMRTGVEGVGKVVEDVAKEVLKGPIGMAEDAFMALSHMKL